MFGEAPLPSKAFRIGENTAFCSEKPLQKALCEPAFPKVPSGSLAKRYKLAKTREIWPTFLKRLANPRKRNRKARREGSEGGRCAGLGAAGRLGILLR